jgi:KipI family sensor histidine kinase inhibitor
MLGFTPGFPYLGGMDERIATPRLETPRTKIHAGSVGIAGAQTGIYPIDSPGGWQIIGRTPLSLYDPGRAEPILLKAGETIKFIPIDQATFDKLQAETVKGRS